MMAMTPKNGRKRNKIEKRANKKKKENNKAVFVKHKKYAIIKKDTCSIFFGGFYETKTTPFAPDFMSFACRLHAASVCLSRNAANLHA